MQQSSSSLENENLALDAVWAAALDRESDRRVAFRACPDPRGISFHAAKFQVPSVYHPAEAKPGALA